MLSRIRIVEQCTLTHDFFSQKSPFLMSFKFFLTPVVVSGLLSIPLSAGSLIYDLGQQHNAIILGNLYVDSADTEGRQLVTGNFETNIGWRYTIGQSGAGHPQNPPSAGRDDLIVGGNYTHSGGSGGGIQVTEDAVVGGSATSDKVYFNNAQAGISSGQGTLTYGAGSLKVDRLTGNVTTASGGVPLTDLSAQFIQESMALSQYADSTGIAVTQDETWALGISTADLALDDTYVINIGQAQWELASYKSRTINAGAGSTVIINVAGTDISLTGGSMLLSGGITPDRVIVNYFEATSFNLGVEHNGTVLAPNTQTVSMTQSINGVAILAGDVSKTNSAEFHNFLFAGHLAVPEPSSCSSLALGLMLTLFFRRRS